jgi:hypothetical protein
MSEDCSKIGCAVPKNAVQEYLNQYSLNQVIVTNDEFTAVINGVTYTIPAGTFSLPITTDTAFPLSYQGCQSNVSVSVPPGSTIGQIQALAQSLLQQVASQQAQCNAAASNPTPSRPKYTNTTQTVSSSCTTSPLTISVSLPDGVSQNGNDLICAAGIFSSDISQSNANAAASDFLENLLNSLFASGEAVCSSDCSVDTGPVPADMTTAKKPTMIRIKDYATSVKPFLAACSGCQAASHPEWDGTFVYVPGDQIWVPNQTSVSINGGNQFNDGAYTDPLLFLGDNNGGGNWEIEIGCASGGGGLQFKGYWFGIKNTGLSPVGTYIFTTPVGGVSACNLGLMSVEIECY